MKKLFALLLSLCLVLGGVATAEGAIFTPGTYEATGKGYSETDPVTVKVTVDENAITAVEIEGAGELPFGQPAFPTYIEALIGRSDAEIEAVSGATLTCQGVVEAVEKALAEAKGEAAEEGGAVAFAAGTYEGTADGYNGPLTLSVTYSDSAIESIEITACVETDHVGTPALEIMIPEILEANGSGVDGVAGATFTSRAIRAAVNDTAEQAACTNLDAFKAAKVEHTPGDPIELEYDIVVVGAGGAGLAAAAQAAQNGDTVVILEKAAEMGGNTLVAGGAFQSVMPYLVWDPADPDATTGVNPIDGETYDKVKNDAGRIDILKTILDWSEEPFDGIVDDDHPFVAGEIGLNAVRGVHEEYLPTLQALKAEIRDYLAWAQPQLDAGVNETQLTLFSTINLHIFQTYYGGLRPSADNSEWIYGDVDLVSQFINGGQDVKPWLVAQGSLFSYNEQSTLIGCLWQRENGPIGGIVDGVEYANKWGAYFMAPMNTVLTANAENRLMLRTTANALIVEDGKVTGVKATQYDGTEVTAKASKGVILTTGGYAANIPMVQQTNIYWDPDFIADNIGTTNRSGMVGDGIKMAAAIGADTVGMGWTQMMPLGWVNNGNLSFGAGENVIFVNAATGKRYVDESAERDVLSKASFENGMTREAAEALGLKYVPGIYVEFSNVAVGSRFAGSNGVDVEGRSYFGSLEDLAAKISCDPEVLRKTIEDYDAYVMGLTDALEVPKLATQGTIGDVEVDENGAYLTDTYKLDQLCMRLMAPSTHHTMGGLKVDTERHVINTDGEIIPGLYAAGEVTGGFMAGNRLGGNAIVEIIVSGRTAANAADADNE